MKTEKVKALIKSDVAEIMLCGVLMVALLS